MSKLRRILGASILMLLAAPVLAEEIVYFTNGTAMPIISHEMKGDVIHVELGDNSFIEFPAVLVEKVEVAGAHVVIGHGAPTGNRVAGGPPEPDGVQVVKGPGYGEKTLRAAAVAAAVAANPGVQVDESGMAVYRPFRSSDQRMKRQVGATGQSAIFNQNQTPGADGRLGTTQIGNRHVIGGVAKAPGRRASGGAPVVGLGRRPGLGSNPSGSGSQQP